MSKAHLIACFAAVMLLVGLAAGCGAHHQFGNDPSITYATNRSETPALEAGKYGSSFSGSFLTDPKTFNLWVADDADSSGIVGVLYDALEGRDSFTLKFEPRLATLPKISADGLTYTYTLRPNLKWSDGQPLTVDDIIFTLDVIFDPNVVSPLRESMEIPVKQANGLSKLEPFAYKKINNRTVQFTLPIVWAPAQAIFSFPIAPKHSLYSIYKAGGFNSAWGIDTPPKELVASGPYVMAQYLPLQRIIFKRNPYFWRSTPAGQRLPFFDRFDYIITPDTDAMVLNFRSGGSDSVTIPPQEYPSVDKYARRDNYTVVNRGTDWGFSYLGFNMNPGSIAMQKDPKLLKLFNDVRFRQACSYAIDRNTLVTSVLLGLGEPLYSPETAADTTYFDPHVQQYPYNLDKARALLKQAGLVPGANGMMTYEGEPVKFNIMTNVENQSRKAMQVIVASNLRQIGLDVTYTAISFNDLIRRSDAKPYDWQTVLMGFTGGPEPNDGAVIWRSTGDYHQWWPKEPKPATDWEARIDHDFDMGAQSLDPKKTQSLLR